MSARSRKAHAAVFSALGDETRLALVSRLSEGQPCSISQLAADSELTRQGITKHLRVLEGAGLVRSIRSGRESLFELKAGPIENAKKYLDLVSEEWDRTLSRLKAFAEENP